MARTGWKRDVSRDVGSVMSRVMSRGSDRLSDFCESPAETYKVDPC